MEVIANHAHVFPESIREDGSLDRLKILMDRCGISKAVAFAPFYSQVKGSDLEPNIWLASKIKNDDRFFGFGTINFVEDDVRSQVDIIYQSGLKGIKIHPAFQKIKIDCPKAFQVYKRAEMLNLPISFHTGIHWHRIKDYNMLLFDEVAYNFPNLRFSLEHVGGYAFFTEAIGVMCNNPENVYAGITSVFDRDVNRFWYLDDQKIMDLFWLTGVERSIFGLDFPYNLEEKTSHSINKIESLEISTEAKKGILGANLLAFMGI